ncbi:hypothetical protein [Aliihoeflea sp. 40Bstr573]|uniref:hypothetical protein n=1 Tax=Aliihoeflea sp. 40Bstr573 TaxID=2696467 RepID=UPI002094FBB1|nr:hypothetical protein [Aliihoeflea sp. 40Bstr573]
MTAYLIDENVLREFGARGNANVRKWLATVDDADLRLSVATLFEKRRGAEALKRRDSLRSAELLKAIAAAEKAFADRIIPVDPRSSRNGRECLAPKIRTSGTWRSPRLRGFTVSS